MIVDFSRIQMFSLPSRSHMEAHAEFTVWCVLCVNQRPKNLWEKFVHRSISFTMQCALRAMNHFGQRESLYRMFENVIKSFEQRNDKELNVIC